MDDASLREYEVLKAPFKSGHGRGSTADSDLPPLRFWSELGAVQPYDRLIRRLLGENSLAVIYGPPSSGKTFFATDMGLRIAWGGEWFGRSVLRGAVLYVAAEGSRGLENRIAAFKKQYAPPGDLPFVVVPATMDLGPNGSDVERVIAAAEHVATTTGHPVRLIVVDTLARAMVGGDDSAGLDMGAAIRNCDRIREATGATVLLVHHSGKDVARGARGHSSLLGAVDTAIEIEKTETGRFARVVKQKDGADGEGIAFDLEAIDIGEAEDGERITSCVIVASDATPAPTGPRLSPTEKLFVQELRNALADAGRVHRGDPNLPTVAVVAREVWHQRVKAAGATMNATSANAERALLSKHTKSLKEKGVIGLWNDFAWLVATDRNHAQPR